MDYSFCRLTFSFNDYWCESAQSTCAGHAHLSAPPCDGSHKLLMIMDIEATFFTENLKTVCRVYFIKLFTYIFWAHAIFVYIMHIHR